MTPMTRPPLSRTSARRTRLRRRHLRRAVTLGEALVGVTVVVILTLTTFVPAIMGWVPLTVFTGSMRPEIPPGSLVVVRSVSEEEANSLGTGAVVTYLPVSGSDVLVTHRIVAVTAVEDGTSLYTIQGDANPTPDPDLVRPSQIRGIMRYHVPYLGRVVSLISPDRKNIGRIVLGGGLAAYSLYEVARGGVDWWRERRRRATLDRTDGAASEDAGAAVDADAGPEPAGQAPVA